MGLWLQKITTKEPDDNMLEAAIAAVNAVCDGCAQAEEYINKQQTEINYEYPRVWEI